MRSARAEGASDASHAAQRRRRSLVALDSPVPSAVLASAAPLRAPRTPAPCSRTWWAREAGALAARCSLVSSAQRGTSRLARHRVRRTRGGVDWRSRRIPRRNRHSDGGRARREPRPPQLRVCLWRRARSADGRGRARGRARSDMRCGRTARAGRTRVATDQRCVTPARAAETAESGRPGEGGRRVTYKFSCRWKVVMELRGGRGARGGCATDRDGAKWSSVSRGRRMRRTRGGCGQGGAHRGGPAG